MADEVKTRDDSLLYTGLTSASSRRLQDKKKQDKEAKQAKRNELVPKADIVLKELEKERLTIAKELGNLIHLEMNEQNIKATVLGLRMADQRLVSVITRLNNILRKKK